MQILQYTVNVLNRKKKLVNILTREVKNAINNGLTNDHRSETGKDK